MVGDASGARGSRDGSHSAVDSAPAYHQRGGGEQRFGGSHVTLVAVAIAGGAGAVTGYVIETLSASHVAESYSQRVALVIVGSALIGFIVTAIVLVVVLPGADESAVLGSLIAAYVGGSVAALAERYLDGEIRGDYGELAQFGTQALLGCVAVSVGAAIGLQM
jgi:hypothetical protein